MFVQSAVGGRCFQNSMFGSAETDASVCRLPVSSRLPLILLPLALLCLLGLFLWLPVSAHTRIVLTDADSGRVLFAAVVPDGEPLTLTWTNSLFGLPVHETFVARSGRLIQQEVTFADPQGRTPASVGARDVEDLYHTGGAFAASGMERPFTKVIFRVGEIGEPRLKVQEREVDFKREVGFGGRVVLTARPPRRYEMCFLPQAQSLREERLSGP